jgi:hypothetical protein
MRRLAVSVILVAAFVLLSSLSVAYGVPSPRRASLTSDVVAAERFDFNGDGHQDLAAMVPGEGLGGRERVGAVNVVYGSGAGLTAAGNQFWSQRSPRVTGVGETGDAFGSAVASGDFDGDGYADLAVGVPLESAPGLPGTGAVNVLYGTARGLSAARNQYWWQDSPGVPGTAGAGDNFGAALAVGNFNADPYADLAVSSRYASEGGAARAGRITVLYGRPAGLTPDGAQVWSQASPGIPGTPEDSDFFGLSTAAGDINGDGLADLAVSAGNDRETTGQGSVVTIFGSRHGLSSAGSQYFSAREAGVPGTSIQYFGLGLAIGDFDGSGIADLAAGAPVATVEPGSKDAAGVLVVLRGTRSGLTTEGRQLWHQDLPRVPGEAEPFEEFGAELAADDLDGDGHDDLVAGSPGPVDVRHPGEALVLYGSRSGLAADRAQLWTQDSPGVPGVGESQDAFGLAPRIGHYNHDRFADLALGVPNENQARGRTVVLYGTRNGLSATAAQGWSQAQPHILGGAERGDAFR